MALPHSDGSVLFSTLPKWKAPWSEFTLSYAAQALIIAIFAWISVLHPQVLEGPKRDYHAIELVPTPVPLHLQPQRQLPRPLLQARLDPPPVAMHLSNREPQPKLELEDIPAPQVKIAPHKLEPMPTLLPAIPKPAVRTNVFSSGSSAPQTIDR